MQLNILLYACSEVRYPRQGEGEMAFASYRYGIGWVLSHSENVHGLVDYLTSILVHPIHSSRYRMICPKLLEMGFFCAHLGDSVICGRIHSRVCHFKIFFWPRQNF